MQNKRTFRRLLQFLKPYTGHIFTTFIALSIAALAVVSLGSGLKELIDEGFAKQNSTMLNQALITLLFSVFIIAAASFLRSFLSSWIGEQVVSDIQQRTFDRLLTLPPEYFAQNGHGNIISRLNTDSTVVQVLLGGSGSTGIRSLVQFIGATAMVFITSAKLASFACLVIPVIMIPIAIFGKKVKNFSRQAQAAIAKTNTYSEESLSGIATVQAFNAQAERFLRYQTLQNLSLENARSRYMARSSLAAIVIFLVFAGVSTVMWNGAHFVMEGKLSSGELVSFIFYAILAAGSINSMAEVFGDWQRASAALERIFELLSVDATIKSPTPGKQIENVKGSIMFKDVNFSYPSRPNFPAMLDFNLNIKPGDTIALVGASGAGKSTLFQLLLRFYDPNAGSITLDGIDLKELNLKSLRNCFGWVQQEPTIFNTTVYENIAFGCENATEARIKEAARIAFAHDFIEQLPEKYNTILADGGSQLSCGQRQRIAIARAILKNPPILLLDEATNSLDAESEHQIKVAIDKLTQSRTTIIVAHRLSTVLNADKIVVLDQGMITAVGSHTTLMRQCNIYRRFAALQFDLHKLEQREVA